MRAGLRPTRSHPGAQVRQNGVELPRGGRVVEGKARQGRGRCGRPSAASQRTPQSLEAATGERTAAKLPPAHAWLGGERDSGVRAEGGGAQENRPWAGLLATGS